MNIFEALKAIRREKDLTLREVSEKSGIVLQQVSDIERGKNKNISLETLASLAPALGVSVIDILVKAGHSPSYKTELEKEIKLTPDLTPSEKETLLTVYRSLKNRE